MKENAVVSCLFYQSLSAIGKVQCLWKKGENSDPIKEVTEAKGETSTLQMGKLHYNAINMNVFVLIHLQNCKTAQSGISHPTLTFLTISL